MNINMHKTFSKIKFPKIFKRKGLSELVFIIIAAVMVSITLFAAFQ